MEQPLYISAEQCRRALTPALALELAETALRWEATGRIRYPEAGALRMTVPETGFRYHSKTVALPEVGVVGSRVVGYTVAPDGTRPGADEATRMIVLMDLDDGRPLAIVDEHYNYALRTAASVGVAARLVHPGPARLGVVGAGVVAQASVRVLLEALEVSELVLFSRTRSRCERLAEETRAITDVGISIASNAAEVLAGYDVVVLATTTKSPIQAGALRPGLVLCALGSNEIDADGYRSASHLLVDDWAQTRAAGDIARMIAAGLEIDEAAAVPLPRLVVGDVAVTAKPEESIIIRTEGLASQDILFAHHVWHELSR
jgi:ornithine cyclodeaminase/alanine dehydrogenase-like protein (mu-crystallin family)